MTDQTVELHPPGNWWGEETRTMPEEEDQLTVRPSWAEGTLHGKEVNWPKAFMVVGCTAIVALTVIIVACLAFLPSEFWTMP